MPAHSVIWKRLGFAFISLTLTLAALGPWAGAPQVAHAAGSYVVDAPLDAGDFANDGNCDDGVGDCTLRAAIEQAFYDGVPTTITFANDLTGMTLALDDTLGPIVWVGDYITVTGEAKAITISGINLGAGKSLFTIEGSHNLLENLTITSAPQDGVQVGDFAGGGTGNHNLLTNLTLIGNGGAGIHVFGGSDGGGQFNTISSNQVGAASLSTCVSGNHTGVLVDQGATGTIIASNYIVCNAQHGVQISNTNGAAVVNNQIGLFYAIHLANGGHGIYSSGTTSLNISANWISGNGLDGIRLENSTQALIQSNDIGTDGTVLTAIPNGANGIQLTAGSIKNTVGSLAPSERNIISGNALNGVLLDGSGTQTNTVVGNYIGTNISGTAAIGNGQNGVRLQNGAHDNTIGGHGSTAVRNVISGNTLDGILLLSGATSNVIDDNFVGLAANGLNAVPNGLGGVALVNAPGNAIGSGYPSTSQYISGNNWQGVYVGNSDYTYIGESNSIGVAVDNVSPLGNGLQGVLINETINSTIVPFAVVNNGSSGVALTGVDSQNDKILPTSVNHNGGLPIDLGADGATANDAGDGDGGPNTLLNYPVVTSFAGSVITGTACANCTVLIYVAYGNPAAGGGGGFEIESASADGAGLWTTALIGGLHRLDVSLVACQSTCGPASNTSEMSPRPMLFLPLTRR